MNWKAAESAGTKGTSAVCVDGWMGIVHFVPCPVGSFCVRVQESTIEEFELYCRSPVVFRGRGDEGR